MALGFKEVFVVPEGLNFTPLDDIPEKESCPVVAYSGRLTRAKRPDHAVRMFRIVREKIPDAEFWVLGDGAFSRELESIAECGVRFFGFLSNEMRRELVRRAWVLVNPSVREGWGLNVVEANALGTPCVAYDVAGLRDSVKDRETGLLAETGDIEDLAEKIVTVLEDTRLREQFSKNALEYARQFNWDKTAGEFMKVLERTVDEG